MKLKLLPNYFKKIGLSLFLLTFWTNFVKGFIDGLNDPGDPPSEYIEPLSEFTFLGINFFSEPFFEVMAVLSLLGLVIYALSKDKVFDELLQKLRLEALRLTFLLSVIFILIVQLLNEGLVLSGQFLMALQVIIFLFIYKIKKVNMKPSGAENYE